VLHHVSFDEEEEHYLGKEKIEKYGRLRTCSFKDEIQQDITKMKPAIQREAFQFQKFSGINLYRLQTTTEKADFTEASTWRHQVGALCTEMRNFHKGPRLSFQSIADFFGVPNGASVKYQWKQFQHGQMPNGRPSVFTKDIIEAIQEMINDRFEKKNPITIVELIDYIQYNFHATVTDDTMRHFISHFKGVQTVVGIPTEAERVETSDSEIKQWYQELSALIKGIPVEFIFNVDETGCSEFVDACELMVLVPDSYISETIDIPVDRHSK
jgi:hypothetical protein